MYPVIPSYLSLGAPLIACGSRDSVLLTQNSRLVESQVTSTPFPILIAISILYRHVVAASQLTGLH